MIQAEATQAIPATDSKLSWMGRIHATSDGVRLGFPGVTLSLKARTSRLCLELEATTPDNWFDVEIDGRALAPVRAQEGSSVLELPEVLDPKTPHVFKLVRRTESYQGMVMVKQVLLSPEAELLDPPELPKRRLLCIGDSITAGSGVDRLPPSYPEDSLSSNANRAYSMELARRLNAQVHLVAYGGRGLTRTWEGIGEPEFATVPTLFERALPDEPGFAWNHDSYTPHAITVCLGTNDFCVGIPDEVEWTAAYERFLARVRQVHPHAWIILATSPMLAVAENLRVRAKTTALEHYLDKIVFRRLEEGDECVDWVAVRGQPGTEKDSHPIAPQHLRIADDIEPVLRSRLGW